MKESNTQELDLLFETSWEVCNKIGGIYTVLSTKAKTLHGTYRDRLIFIGPDVWSAESPSPYFIEGATIPAALGRWAANVCLPHGMTVRVGRWDIPGKPLVVLVRFDGLYATKDAFYGRMWELFGVDSLHAYGDYDEGCAFGRASAIVIQSILGAYPKARNIVAHFDEWTTGMGLLALKADAPHIATIFTTHATSIGRSICGNGKPLYDYLQGYNGDQMARELNMEAKHSLEKAAAWNADCFTTVSEVTARECEQLLDKRPDVVTPNGFEENFVPPRTRYAAARRRARQRLLGVAASLTGVEFDNDNTFVVVTSGRCEYRNKGLDTFLDSMNVLRGRETSGKRVLAYVMVPAWCGGPRPDLASAITRGDNGRLSDPMLTHVLNNYNEDPVNRRMHDIGFVNDADSDVHVIYVPCYLNGSDGIFDMPYYDILPGVDATVFASYYEPWGYTPLESIAFGVPTVTTTLSGFGQWILSTFDNKFDSCGVRVEVRGDSDYEHVVKAIADDIETLLNADAARMTVIRKAASEASARAAWSFFIRYYDEAFAIALANAARREA